jgi:septation ring formation regulator EzrA
MKMGWVSTSEDIEELRQARAHIATGFDDIFRQFEKSQSQFRLKIAEKESKRLAAKVKQYLGRMKKETESAFEEAEKLMRSPNVQIAKKLEKKARQLDEVREKLKSQGVELSNCRQSREEFRIELEVLQKNNSVLQEQITLLEDNDIAWKNEIMDVDRLRKT